MSNEMYVQKLLTRLDFHATLDVEAAESLGLNERVNLYTYSQVNIEASFIYREELYVQMANLRARIADFETTFLGKLFMSAVRAFIGVFIAAEANIFNAFITLVDSHTRADFGVVKNLLLALVAAGLTAAIRAIQHFLFESNTTA